MSEGARSDAFAADEALIERVVSRDVAAFEVLYRKHRGRLAGFVTRLTREPEIADEVVDETMLVLWQRAATFRGASRVSTWLCGIAYRLALKRLGRARREPETVDIDDVPLIDSTTPERRLAEDQLHRHLHAAIGCLPPAQMAVVELTFFHGCSYSEIGFLLDCPVGTVKTRMFHARARLRQALADRGAIDEERGT